jgi:HAE1 family hydrophobic/amphiphilic exporter-1
MSFSEIFVRRPVMTILLTTLMVVGGVWAYSRLPINSLPTVDYPVIQVTVTYPGASPATMASTVATPLENEFTQINGLESMYSDNKQGSTTITLSFSLNRNVDLVAPDVQAAITRATRNLPSDLPNPPTYQKFNPDAPIYYVMFYSDLMPHGELYDYINHMVARKLSMLEGVSRVEAIGAKKAVRIQFSPEKLAAYKIGIDELAMVLKTGTANIPGGSLNGAQRTFVLEPQGQLRTAREYGELIITTRNNAPIRVKDVANCVDSIANDLVNIRFAIDDESIHSQCVVMRLSRISGANTVAVANRVTAALKESQSELPSAITMVTMYNGSEPIKESLHDVQLTVGIALLMVVLVIFFFLGRIRETVVPSIVLPISLLGTFLLMLPSNFSLDILSLMGIILAVGFLVDDAIVVLENTVRHLEEGKKPIPAVLQSMKEISFTVISTSAALIIVFMPLVFMSGAVGRNLREFALTVIFAIIVSTILALTLSPMMCARILRHEKAPNALQRAITNFIQGMIRQYGIALHFQLRHKWLALVSWIVCIAGTVILYLALPGDFLPPGDSSFIVGAMIMPQGSSTEQMQAYQTKVMSVLRKNPEVSKIGSVTGMIPGADQSMGFVFVRLKPPRERPPIDIIAPKLMMQAMAIPDGLCALNPMPVLKISSGVDSTAPGSKYGYLLKGLDRDTVYKTAFMLEQEIRKIPFLHPMNTQNSVKLNMPRLNITIDRTRASALGVTATSIEQALALSFAGGFITQFTTDQDQYQVIPEIQKTSQRLPENLALLYLRSTYGSLVPIKSIINWTEDTGPQNVPHAQQHEAATISFSPFPGVPLGIVTATIESKAATVIPPTVRGSFIGDAIEFKKSITSLGILLLIAIFLKYIVLGMLYESYIHPFTILTTLPVAIFGGFLTLYIFGSTLSLYAFIGVFVLLGLITKNGILMVDFAIQRKAEGMNSYDAIHDACLVRFRPILMTGLCAILGALPIAMGFGADASSRKPLGLVIVGGMIFAQVVTLFVTPGIYLYMEKIQDKFFKPRTDLE